VIEEPAIPEPHVGTSYNPPVDAYQELLLKAHEIEEHKLKESTKLAAVKESMDSLWAAEKEPVRDDVAPGMLVEPLQSETDEDEMGEESGYRSRNRLPERKTKQQRSKAAKVLAEVIPVRSLLFFTTLIAFSETCAR
jgi:nucleolar protein 53